jgi:hypothetical protein
MLFSIDADIGEQIVGWIMPDNPNSTPSVCVSFGGKASLLEATVYRPLLKEQGLHNHGVCGFVVDAHSCPGLSEATDLSIAESETGTLIYRRQPRTETIARKFLRIETQLPFDRFLDHLLAPQFQMAYPRFETVPHETKLSILRIGYSQSLYAAGRIYPRAIDDLARSRGFQFGIVLRDPYEELAERLLVLRWSSEKEREVVASVLGEAVSAVAKSLPIFELGSVEGLRRGLPLLQSPSTARFLSNPLTRQLACIGDEEEIDRNSVAMSLDYLGAFEMVGFRSDMPAALETLGALLDVAAPFLPALPEASPIVKSVGGRLREVAFAEELIGLDLEVYASAERAFRRAGAASRAAQK